jgi:hypothetical protein
MASRQTVYVMSAVLLLAAVGVWGVLFNSYFVSGVGVFVGAELYVAIVILCLLAAAVYWLTPNESISQGKRIVFAGFMAASSILLVAGGPILWCVIFGCRGFDLP